MVGIYGIQSLLKPSRFYIGSSTNVCKRWKHHLSQLKYGKHKNKKLQRHYNKYGELDLKFVLIIECEIEYLIKMEQCFFDAYCPYFNICRIAGVTLGYKHPYEVRLKMKAPKALEHRKKLSEAKKGKKTHRKPTNSFKKGYIPWNKGIRMVITG